MAAEEIKKYQVAYFGAKAGTYRAFIWLLRDDNTRIGGVLFHQNASTIPANDSRLAAEGTILCNLPCEDLPHVLDILRNEKPVFMEFVAGAARQYAMIYTQFEPIGPGDEMA